MKDIYTLLLLVCTLLCSATSCNSYLDVIPEESAKDNDAFKDRIAALKYLYSCYSYLPNPRHQTESLDLLTSDETVTAFEHETFANFPKGNYTAIHPIISYWNTLFQGIRQCYILLENIDAVPLMEPADVSQYKAEATFLIAYYHYLLVKCYGASVLMDSNMSINTPKSEFPSRTPYDDCVEWITSKFDEAISLGLPDVQEASSYGRATKPAALAIKSRMLLYAASPLFNGGKPNYNDSDADDISSALAAVTNADGTPLFNTIYDPQKWQKAADASLEAIKAAERAGVRLYSANDSPATFPEPSDPVEKALRMTITDRHTPELIWCDTRVESMYSLQRKSTPHNPHNGGSWNGIAPTLTMLEMFYSENGLPIDEDPDYEYDKAFLYGEQTNTSHGVGVTLNFNMNREPRFYSWIGYHNSYYELYAYANDEGASNVNRNKMLVRFRKNDNCGIQSRNGNYSPTGYLNKKGVHPSFSRATGGSVINYPWPIIRLAELYLNYAEALIEVGGADNLETAIKYMDKVRTRAGIKGVKEAWSKTGVALTQDKLREVVRRERTIELYLENQRFWDVRRWLLGSKYFNVKAKGMNISKSTDAEFFKVTEVNFTRVFISPAHYLMPIPIGDIDNNIKIIQNPGY